MTASRFCVVALSCAVFLASGCRPGGSDGPDASNAVDGNSSRIEIVGMPTVREPDGLALSSRNRYLSPAERETSLALYRQLTAVADAVRDGKASCAQVAEKAAKALLEAGFDKVEYLTVVDAESLAPLEHVHGPARVAVAARLGRTRLIDNIAV